MRFLENTDAGWSSLVARRAHNPKVVGSNPAPATNVKRSQIKHLFDLAFCILKGGFCLSPGCTQRVPKPFLGNIYDDLKASPEALQSIQSSLMCQTTALISQFKHKLLVRDQPFRMESNNYTLY